MTEFEPLKNRARLSLSLVNAVQLRQKEADIGQTWERWAKYQRGDQSSPIGEQWGHLLPLNQ